MSSVLVTVMGNEVEQNGSPVKWWTCPYNRTEHVDGNVAYETPIYDVVVGKGLDKKIFRAVRFGLVRDNKKPYPKTRISDAGLADQQTAHPTWNATYNPMSFPGSGPKGAWLLYPWGDWFIHEGAAEANMLSASLGCIEIVGPGAWRRFLEAIQEMAGADCATIGAKKLLKVIIMEAKRPTLTRV